MAQFDEFLVSLSEQEVTTYGPPYKVNCDKLFIDQIIGIVYGGWYQLHFFALYCRITRITNLEILSKERAKSYLKVKMDATFARVGLNKK